VETAGVRLLAQGVQVVGLERGGLPGAGAQHLRGQLGRRLLDHRRELGPLLQPDVLFDHFFHKFPFLVVKFQFTINLVLLACLDGLQVLTHDILHRVNLSHNNRGPLGVLFLNPNPAVGHGLAEADFAPGAGAGHELGLVHAPLGDQPEQPDLVTAFFDDLQAFRSQLPTFNLIHFCMDNII